MVSGMKPATTRPCAPVGLMASDAKPLTTTLVKPARAAAQRRGQSEVRGRRGGQGRWTSQEGAVLHSCLRATPSQAACACGNGACPAHAHPPTRTPPTPTPSPPPAPPRANLPAPPTHTLHRPAPTHWQTCRRRARHTGAPMAPAPRTPNAMAPCWPTGHLAGRHGDAATCAPAFAPHPSCLRHPHTLSTAPPPRTCRRSVSHAPPTAPPPLTGKLVGGGKDVRGVGHGDGEGRVVGDPADGGPGVLADRLERVAEHRLHGAGAARGVRQGPHLPVRRRRRRGGGVSSTL